MQCDKITATIQQHKVLPHHTLNLLQKKPTHKADQYSDTVPSYIIAFPKRVQTQQ